MELFYKNMTCDSLFQNPPPGGMVHIAHLNDLRHINNSFSKLDFKRTKTNRTIDGTVGVMLVLR